jgi:translation initiation factor 1 (eIF-1/SUI1)
MMGAAEELRVLANSIIDSYEMRVSTVNTLMGQANNLLKGFQIELEEMITLLRDNLAKSESLRKKDFEHMIKDVIERRIQRGQETEQSFKLFQGEEEEMIARLRDIIFSGNSSSLDDIEAIREDILRRQKMREKKIVKSLKCFQVEQEELRVALKKLLSKGENVKIKDFKTMINALRIQQSDHNADMIRMLEEFDVVRDKVQTQWQAVSRVSGG